jgi:hypothetical protein
MRGEEYVRNERKVAPVRNSSINCTERPASNDVAVKTAFKASAWNESDNVAIRIIAKDVRNAYAYASERNANNEDVTEWNRSKVVSVANESEDAVVWIASEVMPVKIASIRNARAAVFESNATKDVRETKMHLTL